MKLKTISRRSFLKGAGVAALAVATAGVMTGCSSSSSSKKTTPTSTPTTKEVEVKYVDSEDKVVCTKTVNVDFTKLDPTSPKISSDELALPEDYADDYSVIAGEYPVQKNDDKYYIVVRVKKNQGGDVADEKVDMPVHFYIKTNYGHSREEVTANIANGALVGQTMSVAKDATTVDVSYFDIISGYGYELAETTGTVENGGVWIWVKRING